MSDNWAEGEEERLEKEIKRLIDEENEQYYYTLIFSMGLSYQPGYLLIDGEYEFIPDLWLPKKGLTRTSPVDERIECIKSFMPKFVASSLYLSRSFMTRKKLLSNYIILFRYDVDNNGKKVKYFCKLIERFNYSYIDEKEISLEDFNKLKEEHEKKCKEERIRREDEEEKRKKRIREREEEEKPKSKKGRYEEDKNDSDSDSDSSSDSDSDSDCLIIIHD